MKLGKSAAALAIAGLCALALGSVALAATSLTLSQSSGPPGAGFDAQYRNTTNCSANTPSAQQVRFYFDGYPGSGTPGTAFNPGTSAVSGPGCQTPQVPLKFPAAARCGTHTVYGFIPNGNGGVVTGSVASAAYDLTCPQSPGPAGSKKPTPTPKPVPTPVPTKTARVVPTPSPLPTPFTIAGTPPVCAAGVERGAPATLGGAGASTKLPVVLYALAAAVMAGWGVLFALRLRHRRVTTAVRWGSFGGAVLLAGVLVLAGGLTRAHADSPTQGYYLVAADGGIFPFGTATGASFGSAATSKLPQPVVGMKSTPDGAGYWLVGADGAIYPFGSAVSHVYGSSSATRLDASIVGMESTPNGLGYWLVGTDGAVQGFGEAVDQTYGDTAHTRLKNPIVGMEATCTGHGYWLVASDGAIYAFGDALTHKYGGTAGRKLSSPIVAMEATRNGAGYWLVSADGGVFPFGNAVTHSYGSAAGTHLAKPIVDMEVTPSGKGYWLVAADGAVFPFGDAEGAGSAAGTTLAQPVVGIEAKP
ncbi:MAG: hypothetical protein QOK05_564 [Chloroflexota bacterium]|jgi:hypothetical protein|nr:hypothetical protein [Chloroflexota bacterium]